MHVYIMSNHFDNNSNSEIVHEGWLTKSPPNSRIWRARWRKRWFVLRHSGEIPGQYFLCYYTDQNHRKLKGQIDLDQCEQVDAGLRFESRKLKYQHMFDIKTPKRTYYLAAENEDDMNRWVDAICHICGLKTYPQDSPPISPSSTGPYIPISECYSGDPLSADRVNDFLANSNGLKNTSPFHPFDESFDWSKKFHTLRPGNLDLRAMSGECDTMTPPPQSPATDGESVFTDDDSIVQSSIMAQKPIVNWETFPRPSDSSLEGDVPKLSLVPNKRYTRTFESAESSQLIVAPPRPPKPCHLVLTPTSTTGCPNCHQSSNNCESCKQQQLSSSLDTQNKSNHQLGVENCYQQKMMSITPKSDVEEPPSLEGETEDGKKKVSSTTSVASMTADDVFDTSRSQQIESKRANLPNTSGEIFRYDFDISTTLLSDPSTSISPSIGSSAVTSHSQFPSESPLYSNLPSPTNLSTPPLVNRELKPGRKLSDSTNSNEASPNLIVGSAPMPAAISSMLVQHSPMPAPPNIDRKLKPLIPFSHPIQIGKKYDTADGGPLQLASPPGSFGPRRAAPSPIPPQVRRHSTSDDDLGMYNDFSNDQIYIYNNTKFHTMDNNYRQGFSTIQYLDLDFFGTSASSSSPSKSFEPSSTVTSRPLASDANLNGTPYKTIDFLKTEAFNRTRQQAELQRQQLQCAQATL